MAVIYKLIKKNVHINGGYINYVNVDSSVINDSEFTGENLFKSGPIIEQLESTYGKGTPINDNNLVNKKYVDDLILGLSNRIKALES